MIEYKVALVKNHSDIPMSVSGVNAKGQFVGTVWSQDILPGAFLYDQGDIISLPKLGVLGLDESYATDINDAGDICGWVSSTNTGQTKACLWTDGGQALKPIDPLLGGTGSQAFGLNSSGEVTGRTVTAAGDHAFRLSKGVAEDLGALSDGPSVGYDINDDGSVVGQSGEVAFVYTDGLMSPVDDYLIATGINQAGQVTGGSGAFFRDISGTVTKSPNTTGFSIGYAVNSSRRVVGSLSNYAFRWDYGKDIENLNHFIAPLDDGDSLKEAYDINELGQIVGVTELGHGFLLTPVDPIHHPHAVPTLHGISPDKLSMVYILAGIIGGGGGIIYTPGGKGGPVPDPGGPPDTGLLAAFRALAPKKRDILVGLALDELAALVGDAGTRRHLQDMVRRLVQNSSAGLAAVQPPLNRDHVQTRARFGKQRKFGKFSAGA